MKEIKNIDAFIAHIRHYLPSQSALKDFIHHNTLHGFQNMEFHAAMKEASSQFGYSTYLSIDEFRQLYHQGRISEDAIRRVIDNNQKKQDNSLSPETHLSDVLEKDFSNVPIHRADARTSFWKDQYGLSVNKAVHPKLFRVLASYLDQGVAQWTFPSIEKTFLESLHSLESNGLVSLFTCRDVKADFLNKRWGVMDLLESIIGVNTDWKAYLTDLLMSHPGWSGYVSVMESEFIHATQPRPISVEELIVLELYLEMDLLTSQGKESNNRHRPKVQYMAIKENNNASKDLAYKVLSIWQEAYELNYHHQVLEAIQCNYTHEIKKEETKFQALFCIDDREYTVRRHLHMAESQCQTYGTPGFFGLPFYFLQHEGHLHSKACPAPVQPEIIIFEKNRNKRQKENHIHHLSHGFTKGWIISNLVGIGFGFKLLINLFRPKKSLLGTESKAYMSDDSEIVFENNGEMYQGLRVGFTLQEMIDFTAGVLQSIGLTNEFAPFVYIIGHGASSINNPYFAGYDCGACSGRPGSINARVFAKIANKPEVRNGLQKRGINISQETIFIGGLHDTTNDEIFFYDLSVLDNAQWQAHQQNHIKFNQALHQNKLERALRFDELKPLHQTSDIIRRMNQRSVSLFEIRPEWNHTDNALVIIGNSNLVSNIYLDKRPFLNSYNYRTDPKGEILQGILRAAIPVCGGINLEYYFSRVDTQNLGAGSKLPHNIVGLFGLSNGVDGDLRPGLPSQMIEIHEPVRILFIIEQNPEVVFNVIQNNPTLHDWVFNEWVKLSVIDPITHHIYFLKNKEWKKMDFEKSKRPPNQSFDIGEVIEKKSALINFKEEVLS